MTSNHFSGAGQWRVMLAADLPAVSLLASRIHPGFPEDDAVFAERLKLYPRGCRVFELETNGRIAAYLISHPGILGEPPVLNSLLGELPAFPSTFYIHDLALAAEVRGMGAAGWIVTALAEHAYENGFDNLSLVAVNGSAAFWLRQGFRTDALECLDPQRGRMTADKLRSYGDDAQFMVRDLSQTAGAI